MQTDRDIDKGEETRTRKNGKETYKEKSKKVHTVTDNLLTRNTFIYLTYSTASEKCRHRLTTGNQKFYIQ